MEGQLQSDTLAAASRVYAYLGPDCALTQLTDGHFIYVDPYDESLSPHLIARGYWEQWVETVVHALVRPGSQVIEVGANLGYYTLKLARDVGPIGRVRSFEANPIIFRLLHRSVRFNGYLDRVSLVNARLLNARDEVQLFVDPKCTELIDDFEQVSYEEDSTQVDKNKDRRRTHLSDALGYLIWQEDRNGTIGERGERLF